jgi:GNAT superfamily N-acetyltransferase
MDRLAPAGEGMAPGFVWIEDNHVVGNVSVRRMGSWGRGWLIGNVAVSPEWRRRGIARSLMQAAIDLVHRRRGEWIALQVRSDGMPARTLYRSLGFRDTGETIQYRRARFVPAVMPTSPVEGRLRRATAADAQRIFSLAQSAIPEALRWAEPLRRDEFWLGFDRDIGNWLAGRHEAWWVIDSSQGIVGASHAEVSRGPDDGRLGVWVSPGWQGRHEARLVHAALASLGQAGQRPLLASAPALHAASHAALEAVGFGEMRRLSHMRLDVR